MSSVEIGYPPNLMPRMTIQSRGRMAYSPKFKWKVLVSAWNHCTKASPISCLMVYEGILKNPRILAVSGNLHTTSGPQNQIAAEERWTKLPDHGSCLAPAFKIRSYPLAHTYNRYQNDKRRKTAYLSFLHLSRRMTLQLALKVSVSNIAVYHSSMSISLGLMWQES